MKPRVLVTRHVYSEALDLLRPVADVEYRDAYDGEAPALLRARLADKVAVVCQLTDPMPAVLFDAAPHLRIVANIAVGHDNIDVPAATARGILVSNTPGVLTESTADFTFALLLAAARRVVEADAFVRAGRFCRWQIDLLCGTDVHGKTLGIVGAGRIGAAVARRARGFDMRVLYAHPRRVEGVAGEHVPLPELLQRSDFVSLHVPLTPATTHLIDAPALRRMPPHAILVNTARGPVVDEAALVAALRERVIAGAALDVFEREPELSAGLTDLDNVVVAPHLGSATVATRTRMCTMAAANVVAFLSGERPPNLVDAAAWERRR